MPIINLALETPQVQEIINILENAPAPHRITSPLIQTIVQQANAQLAVKPILEGIPEAVAKGRAESATAPETPAAASVRKALKRSKTIPLPPGAASA